MILTLYQMHIVFVAIGLVLMMHTGFLFVKVNWLVTVFCVMLLSMLHYYVGGTDWVLVRLIGSVLVLWFYLQIHNRLMPWQHGLSRVICFVSMYLWVSQAGYAVLNFLLPHYIVRSPVRFLMVVNIFDVLVMVIAYLLLKRYAWHREIPLWSSVLLMAAASYLFPPLRYSKAIMAHIPFNRLILYQLLIVSMVLGLLISFFAYYRAKKRLETQAVAQLVQYAQDVEALYDSVSMFRHDYLNILYSLQLSIDQANWEEVAHIFYETVAPTQKLLLDQSYEFGKLGRIATLELKSLLHSKLVLAQSKGLKVQLDIPKSLPDISFDKVKLVRAVAILLDNAIEAAVQSEQKEISVALFDVEEVRHIHVVNSSVVSSVGEQLRYTTKSQAQEHGWGLYYLHQLVQHNPRIHLLTEVVNGTVQQQLLIEKSVTSIKDKLK
ncbi:GHKL domain-containing protein [Aerococcaceae bacterium NML180378]|nr:GHKL domain-containing protein [Aerococcaceae bacterium NML180378]